jgi:leucyl/phenylalanyl-tRNA--protein transferase
MAASRSGPIAWYSPDPRAVIPLGEFRISRSLRQTMRRNVFEIRVDTDCDTVIRCCAEREETWISDEIVHVYGELHRCGYVHSVESWYRGNLVGGLYGVAIRGAFFGESMFSKMTDASKVALVHLVGRLKERKFTLLDTQYINDHVRQFGAVEISRDEYLLLLESALRVEAHFI